MNRICLNHHLADAQLKDRVMFRKINTHIRKATRILKELGYKSEDISAKEFYDYMTGETPTGDTITLNDVLANKFLMIHEVAEISELKKRSMPINKQTIMSFHPKVYEAHFTATEFELNHAVVTKDYAWLKLRLGHAKDWLEDDYLPQELTSRCKSMIRKFSEYLPKC